MNACEVAGCHVHKLGTAGCECGHIPATLEDAGEPSEVDVLRAARERIAELEAENARLRRGLTGARS